MASRARHRLYGLALAVSLAAGAAHADLTAAKRFYDQATAEKDPARQIPLLQKSLEAEPTFEAYLALGEAQAAKQAFGEARQSLEKALAIAANDKARARATSVTAEIFLAQGQRSDAVALFRRSLQYHPYPNVTARLKEVELETADVPVSAEAIAGALLSTATRSFSVQAASIDLRIGFALGSAELDAKGRAQVRELGKALGSAGLAGKTVDIVGHTDKQGDEDYNQKLSERRAETVRRVLVQEAKVAPVRLTAVGKGESELLYPGDSDSDHALNRRVEIRLREAP
jgi:outer membrane protein OmpA-like peptidoglycan-associated protein